MERKSRSPKDDEAASGEVASCLLGYLHLIDSLCFDPQNEPQAAAAAEIHRLAGEQAFTLNVAHPPYREMNSPGIAEWVRQEGLQFKERYLSKKIVLTNWESGILRRIEGVLDAVGDKARIEQTARNIYESKKYSGCFITADESILALAEALWLCCGARIIRPSEFLAFARLELEARAKSVYGLPIFRSQFSVTSPNGLRKVSMPKTNEAGMGNPMVGDLLLSDGLVLEYCSPSFVWSDDSRYLAVPQMGSSPGLFFSVRLLVIDTRDRVVFKSGRYRRWLQPESFSAGRLVVCVNPWGPSSEAGWDIPSGLASFKRCSYEQSAKPAAQPQPAARVAQRAGNSFRLAWPWPFLLAACCCIGAVLSQIYIPADFQEPRINTGTGSLFWPGVMIVLPLLWLLLLPMQLMFPQKLRWDFGYFSFWVNALFWAALMVFPVAGAMSVGLHFDKDVSTERRYSVPVTKREAGGGPTKKSYFVETVVYGMPVLFSVNREKFQNINADDKMVVAVVKGRSGRTYITGFP